ncbi:MAG TPA: hypothetical protein VLW88_13030 [Hyphomicrobium sp.]|nr:hypothetical protein [Hyphomicrobium sp.]
MNEKAESQEKGPDVVRAEVLKIYERASVINQTFESFGDEEPGVHNHSTLGRRIQNALMDSNETVESFRKRSGLSESELQNMLNGHFQKPTIGKVLKGLASLSETLARRQNRIEVGWVSIQKPEGRKLAEKARKSLELLLDDVKASNEAGEEDSGITPAQRAQLIVLAKALVTELEGSFVDKGRLNSILRWLKRIAVRAATKYAVNKVTGGIDLAIDGLEHLSTYVSDMPSFDIPDDTNFTGDA